MSDPGTRARLRAWLASVEARDAVADLDRALGWTALCFVQYPDAGHVTAYGFWSDPIEAARWAADFQAQMEHDTEDDPNAPAYAVIPHPILPA